MTFLHHAGGRMEGPAPIPLLLDPADPTLPFEIRIFHPFLLRRRGNPIHLSRTSRLLLAVTALSGPEGVHREELKRLLWTAGAIRNRKRRLAQLIHIVATRSDPPFLIRSGRRVLLPAILHRSLLHPLDLAVEGRIDLIPSALQALEHGFLPQLRCQTGEALEDWLLSKEWAIRGALLERGDRTIRRLEKLGDFEGVANLLRLLSRMEDLTRERCASAGLSPETVPELREVFGPLPSSTEKEDPPDSPASSEPPPFLGRSLELRSLLGALRSSGSSGMPLHFIVGERGIGKTSLLEAALPTLRREGRIVLSGRCSAAEGDRLSLLLTDVLTDAPTGKDSGARPSASLPPRTLRKLALLAETGETPGPETGLFRELAALLESGTPQRPLILLVDDAHFGDGRTFHFLEHLMAPELEGRIRCLLLVRPEELQRTGGCWISDRLASFRVGRIPLGGLPRREGLHLLRGHLGEEVPPSVPERILFTAGGNPELLRELAIAWESGELVLPDPPFEPGLLRGRLVAPFTRQVDALPERARSLLSFLVLSSHALPVSVLPGLLGSRRTEATDALETLRHRGIAVERDGRVALRSELLRMAMRSRMGESAQAVVHRRLAACHRHSGGSPEHLAFHLAAARSRLPERTGSGGEGSTEEDPESSARIGWLLAKKGRTDDPPRMIAGARALLDLGHPIEASRLLDLCDRTSPDPSPERSEWIRILRFEAALQARSEPDGPLCERIEAFRRERRRGRDPHRRFALIRISREAELRSAGKAARRSVASWAGMLRPILRDGDVPLRRKTHLLLGHAAFADGRPDRALREIDAVIALAQDATPSGSAGSALLESAELSRRLTGGWSAPLREALDRQIDPSRAAGERWRNGILLAKRALLSLDRREVDRAGRLLRKAEEEEAGLAPPRFRAFLFLALGREALFRNDWKAAAHSFGAGYRLPLAPRARNELLAGLGLALRSMGRSELPPWVEGPRALGELAAASGSLELMSPEAPDRTPVTALHLLFLARERMRSGSRFRALALLAGGQESTDRTDVGGWFLLRAEEIRIRRRSEKGRRELEVALEEAIARATTLGWERWVEEFRLLAGIR